MNDRSSGLHDQSSKSAERLPSYRPPTGHTRNRVKTGGSRPFGRARWCASAIRETEPSPRCWPGDMTCSGRRYSSAEGRCAARSPWSDRTLPSRFTTASAARRAVFCRELSAVSRRSGNLQISGIAVSTEAVPHAANCLDKWVHLRAVNLATNAPHINVDDVGCRIEMKVPHMLQQHRPGNDPAFVAD